MSSPLIINTTKVRRYHFLHRSRRIMPQPHCTALTGISNTGPRVGSEPHWRGQAEVTWEEGWTEPQADARAGSGGQKYIKVFPLEIPKRVFPSSS